MPCINSSIMAQRLNPQIRDVFCVVGKKDDGRKTKDIRGSRGEAEGVSEACETEGRGDAQMGLG